MTAERTKLGYVPELDGVRGLAILAVMMYHAGVRSLKGGFIGVDAFFVLSGFLITSLLLQEFDNRQHINLKHFYLRRVLRLAPALILLLVSFTAISLAIGGAQTRSNLIDVFIVLFYVANWACAFHIHPPQFLRHAWSLSIEEQFYILWPMLLVGLIRLTRSRCRLVLAVSALILAAWLERICLATAGSSAVRLGAGLDTRADALLVGCLLAIILSSDLIDERARYQLAMVLKILAPLCLVGLVVFSVYADWRGLYMFYWGMLVVELLVAGIILDVFMSENSIVRQIVSMRLLVWVGRISYGLYLWHFPVYRSMKVLKCNGAEVVIGGTCITFCVALISYHFLERPFLRLKKRFAPNSAGSSVQVSAVLSGSGGAIEAAH